MTMSLETSPLNSSNSDVSNLTGNDSYHSSVSARSHDALMIVGDTLVLVLLVVLWSVSMAMFWRRWKKFSFQGPRVLDLYQQPKNLDSVTVVPHPVDSVIYRSYPKHVVSVMQARQQRLNTNRQRPSVRHASLSSVVEAAYRLSPNIGAATAPPRLDRPSLSMVSPTRRGNPLDDVIDSGEEDDDVISLRHHLAPLSESKDVLKITVEGVQTDIN